MFSTLLRGKGSQLIICSPGTGFDTRETSPPNRIVVDYGHYIALPAGTQRLTKQAVVLGTFQEDWKWDSQHPVHMICHSQGGNTVRLLIELLLGGHGARHPTYFNVEGRQKFVKSMVTLGTPFRGTTITDVIFNVSPYL
jgi:triacylglycerol esterase/lipase EstA (alpha/beta hydrolase family)